MFDANNNNSGIALVERYCDQCVTLVVGTNSNNSSKSAPVLVRQETNRRGLLEAGTVPLTQSIP
ncbi:MAG TPA: hypothetical protein VF172_07380 [Nitrososphaera sp.]